MRTAALLAAGLAFGLAVELVFYDGALGPALGAADLAVGWLLLVCGAIAWDRRPASRVGALMVLAGLTWFLGNIAAPLLFLHRGPLVHLHLSYPTGRVPTRLAGAVVAVAYLDAAVEPLARRDVLTLALAAAVALAAIQVFAGTSGPARKAGLPALLAALGFAGVLSLGSVVRLADWDADRQVLWLYDVVIASVAVVLLADLLRGRWSEAVVTGLVVDLGAAADTRTLQGTLARALGDPSLVVVYWLPETETFVDQAGREVAMPTPGSGRTATPLVEAGERVAVLIHDEALLADRTLVGAAAASARLAVANARLQAEARVRAEELEASRRRIVEAAEAQRRRLEQQLRLGAELRLERADRLLAAGSDATDDGGTFEQLRGELRDARRELGDFALGVHPAALTDGGLRPALELLANRSPLDARVRGTIGRHAEAVEGALYFVCSEALVNAAKHGEASVVTIDVRDDGGLAALEVTDNGRGGADATRGYGLRGLIDRVEALGGRLSIESALGGGTRVAAAIPSLPAARPAAVHAAGANDLA
jgi:signal transduction histidine kinase